MDTRTSVVAFALFVVAFFAIRRRWPIVSRTRSPTDGTHVPAKKFAHSRNPGEWAPVKFSYPQVTPIEGKIVDIPPVAYRPFKPGEYHVTMGVRSMDWNTWIELDNQFAKYHAIRGERIRTRGERVVRVLPDQKDVVGGGGPAAIELVHELAGFLAARYPLDFTISHGKGGEIKTVKIVALGLSYELPRPGGDAHQAMEICANLVQDDLALMIEGTDGRYYFQAGAICIAGTWRLSDKIGMALDEIHLSGNVPQYREKLHTSLGRFFSKLAVDKPVQRNNYLVQVGPVRGALGEEVRGLEEIAWAETTNGPEDAYIHGQGPVLPPRIVPEGMKLRVERQTLRRLPLSGAIVFTIRTYMSSIEDICMEEGARERLRSAISGWGNEVREYKGIRVYEKEVMEYLNKDKQKK